MFWLLHHAYITVSGISALQMSVHKLQKSSSWFNKWKNSQSALNTNTKHLNTSVVSNVKKAINRFPWQDFTADIFLTAAKSPTLPGFPDKFSPFVIQSCDVYLVRWTNSQLLLPNFIEFRTSEILMTDQLLTKIFRSQIESHCKHLQVAQLLQRDRASP